MGLCRVHTGRFRHTPGCRLNPKSPRKLQGLSLYKLLGSFRPWEQCHLNLNLICSHVLQCAKQESKSCIVFGCVLFKALRHVFYDWTMTYSMPCLKVCLLIAICLLIRTRECALQSRHPPYIKKTQYSLP